MHILLLPLLLVVLFQGILPFSMLLSSGVKSIMESNAVDLDSYLVENSKVILENAMIEQWSAVRKESNYLNSKKDGRQLSLQANHSLNTISYYHNFKEEQEKTYTFVGMNVCYKGVHAIQFSDA